MDGDGGVAGGVGGVDGVGAVPLVEKGGNAARFLRVLVQPGAGIDAAVPRGRLQRPHRCPSTIRFRPGYQFTTSSLLLLVVAVVAVAVVVVAILLIQELQSNEMLENQLLNYQILVN